MRHREGICGGRGEGVKGGGRGFLCLLPELLVVMATGRECTPVVMVTVSKGGAIVSIVLKV